MLVAPLSLPVPPSVARGAPMRATPDTRSALAVWFALGLGVLAAVPGARGDALLGATVPFWLVAAPLIGLVWLERKRLVGVLSAPWRRRRPRRVVAPRQAHRIGACSRRGGRC